MDYMVFLLNMRISGIKSIEKEIAIDFYGKVIDKSFNPGKNKVKGIYGENGTGKSAIIAAVDIVKNFIFDDNYLKTSKSLLKELINKNSKEFYFCCEFVTNIDSQIIFEYDVRMRLDEISDQISVVSESLKCREKSSKNIQRNVFVCENGVFQDLIFDDAVKETIIDRTKNLLSDHSALYLIFSMVHEEGFKDFSYILYPILFFLMVDTYFDREDQHVDYYNKRKLELLRQGGLSSEKLLDELIEGTSINESKVLISSFKQYEENVKRLEEFVRLFKPNLKGIDIEKRENKEFYECELLLNYGDYRINKEFESTGIKKIMNLYNLFVRASIGGIVFIDELDSNINDIYLCKIIEYFKYYGRGQICFTSHNTDPMKVLKDSNKSIDFITRDNRIVPWVKNGHYSPDKSYKDGLIMGLPFNIDAADFIGLFERMD